MIAAEFHILILKGFHPLKDLHEGMSPPSLVTIWRTTWRRLWHSRISSETLMEAHEVAFRLKNSWSIIRLPLNLSLGKKRGFFRASWDLIMDQRMQAMCTSDPLWGCNWASETDHNKCMMQGQQCRGNLVCKRQTQSVVQKKAKQIKWKDKDRGKDVNYRSQ